jgi:hypothetical protein
MNSKPSPDDLKATLQSLVQPPETVQFDADAAHRRAVQWRSRKQQAKHRMAGFVCTSVAMLIGGWALWPWTGATDSAMPESNQLVQSEAVPESSIESIVGLPVVNSDKLEQARITSQLARLDQMRQQITALRREAKQLQRIRKQQRFWITREKLTRGRTLTPHNL